MSRVVVDVREKNGLRERGLDMLSGASVSMSACTNLEVTVSELQAQEPKGDTYFVVEGAIHTVLLSTEDISLGEALVEFLQALPSCDAPNATPCRVEVWAKGFQCCRQCEVAEVKSRLVYPCLGRLTWRFLSEVARTFDRNRELSTSLR
jgi:hypothetical protein